MVVLVEVTIAEGGLQLYPSTLNFDSFSPTGLTQYVPSCNPLTIGMNAMCFQNATCGSGELGPGILDYTGCGTRPSRPISPLVIATKHEGTSKMATVGLKRELTMIFARRSFLLE